MVAAINIVATVDINTRLVEPTTSRFIVITGRVEWLRHRYIQTDGMNTVVVDYNEVVIWNVLII